MKRSHLSGNTAAAGGGATHVPFFEFVRPNLYIGDAVAGLVSAGIKSLGRGVAAIRRWNMERTTRQTLEGLDNRTLADIGVARSEIRAIARAAAGNPTFKGSRFSRWTE